MKMRIFLILGLVLSAVCSQAVTIKEVRTTTRGQLAGLIDNSFYSADSLIVSGPIDDKDMAVLKTLTQKGNLTGLNLKNSSIENSEGYWFTNDPDAPDSLQVKLRYVHLPDNCKGIGFFSFAYVKSLKGIYKDQSEDRYFEFSMGSLKGTSIKTIDFGSTELIFMAYSLQDAIELENIKGLGPKTYVYGEALYNTPKLKGSATFESMLWFGDRNFSHTSLDEIIITAVENVTGEAWFEYANAKRISIESNGIITVSNRAFFGCQNLKSLTLPGSVYKLTSNCLNQTGLEVLTLPEGLGIIEAYAMGWNLFLREIVFPSTLECIGPYNAKFWRSIEKIYVKAQTPPECIIDDNSTGFYHAFDGANKNATLYVPRGTLEAYRDAPGWNYFSKIEEFDFADIQQAKALPANRPIVSTGKGFIYLESPNPTTFPVFDMDGHTLQSGTVEGGHEVSLPSGLYLIQFGEDTQKLLVK